MTRRTRPWLFPLLASLAVPERASAQSIADCYDLKIYARVIEQIPSEAPDCADCIVMRWPWFLDFRVKRVDEGAWTGRALTALSVQHTYLRSRYGSWWLRKNDAGGYNVVQSEDDATPQRCPASTGPASAYLRPGPAASLDQMRAAGERHYGKAPR